MVVDLGKERVGAFGETFKINERTDSVKLKVYEEVLGHFRKEIWLAQAVLVEGYSNLNELQKEEFEGFLDNEIDKEDVTKEVITYVELYSFMRKYNLINDDLTFNKDISSLRGRELYHVIGGIKECTYNVILLKYENKEGLING